MLRLYGLALFECESQETRGSRDERMQQGISKVVGDAAHELLDSCEESQERNDSVDYTKKSEEKLSCMAAHHSACDRHNACQKVDDVVRGVHMKDAKQVLVGANGGKKSHDPYQNE